MAETIRRLGPWFHNLHLDDGTQTAPDHPLGDFPAFKWREIEGRLPFSLQDARVLDVGCNAGYHSFRMSALGADVTAVDMDDHYLRQAHWARQYVRGGADVELHHASVYDLRYWTERFDVINFMGVFYHLRYPLLALDTLAARCGRWLIFQTLVLPRPEGEGDAPHPAPEDTALDELVGLNDAHWPRLAFVEHRLAGDPTNWWVPNEAAVPALLRSAGFQPHSRLEGETWLAERVRDAAGPECHDAAGGIDSLA